VAWKVLDTRDRVLAAYEDPGGRVRAEAERDHLVDVHGWPADELRVEDLEDEPGDIDELEEA
jgi:hypothetical protein